MPSLKKDTYRYEVISDDVILYRDITKNPVRLEQSLAEKYPDCLIRQVGSVTDWFKLG